MKQVAWQPPTRWFQETEGPFRPATGTSREAANKPLFYQNAAATGGSVTSRLVKPQQHPGSSRRSFGTELTNFQQLHHSSSSFVHPAGYH